MTLPRTEIERILACPFCGNECELDVAYGIPCTRCPDRNCTGGKQLVPIEKWNTRAALRNTAQAQVSWTDEQCAAFLGAALRNVELVGERGPSFSDVRLGLEAALASENRR